MVSNLWFWGGWWWLAPSSTVTMMPLQWINEIMILGWWSLWPRSWRQALTTAYKAMPARSHRRSWCDNAIVYVQQISRWHIVCCKLLQVRSGFRHAKRLLSSESPHWRTTTWTVAKWILKAWRKKKQHKYRMAKWTVLFLSDAQDSIWVQSKNLSSAAYFIPFSFSLESTSLSSPRTQYAECSNQKTLTPTFNSKILFDNLSMIRWPCTNCHSGVGETLQTNRSCAAKTPGGTMALFAKSWQTFAGK